MQARLFLFKDMRRERNLRQLLTTCLHEHEWVKQSKHDISGDMINEVLIIMTRNILRSLISDLGRAKLFSIIADETRGIAYRGYYATILCIRYVSENNEMFEDPVGLIQVENTTASTTHAAIKRLYKSAQIGHKNCRGQAYDGASNFQCKRNGDASKFREECPATLSVHCLAHCLNLIL